MTVTISAELRDIGATFSPPVLARTRELYRPLVSALPFMARERIADIAYGPHPRHRLDVFPADRQGAPVLLFIHGGGFVGGDKSGDDVFYANVGRYFAARGFCTVAINYRLAPDAIWPAGAEDTALAMAWITTSIEKHGGDPERIVILGQSAGASHAASYLFDPSIDAAHRARVRAAALMSGFYTARAPLEGGPRLYFEDDETLWHDRSPTSHVIAGHPPILITVAELDPAVIAGQSFLLAGALNDADGRPPRLCWFAGHNHVSTVHGLGLADDEVGRTLSAFFEEALVQWTLAGVRESLGKSGM